MPNPFVFEEFATGEHFCGREQELATLKEAANDSKNILLYSKRRYGKSSLIKEHFARLEKKGYLLIYVDFFEILDEYDFARLFYAAAGRSMRFSLKSALRGLQKYFTRASFSITVGSDGEPIFSPSLASRSFDELIEDAFGGVLGYLKDHNLRGVLAFDEFQQISNIRAKRIDAIIRKHIQSHGQISYIFSGSKKHLLTGLFSDYKAPLYGMASGMELAGVKEEEFLAFANKHLGGRMPRDVFARIYRVADGESKLIQHICYHLYGGTSTITLDRAYGALEKILKESDGEHRMIYDRLTIAQRTAIKAIALHEGHDVYAKETLIRLNVTKSSMTAALKALLDSEMIDREGEGRYFINGRKFELWCRWQIAGVPVDTFF